MAEVERDNIRFRTKEGLRKAKENRVILGKSYLEDKKKRQLLELYQVNATTVKTISKHIKVNESSIYKTVKESDIRIEYFF